MNGILLGFALRKHDAHAIIETNPLVTYGYMQTSHLDTSQCTVIIERINKLTPKKENNPFPKIYQNHKYKRRPYVI